jgi:hypothetical protein
MTQHPLEEYSRVVLTQPLHSAKDEIIPAGTVGVIVSVYQSGAEYAVEFFGPHQGVEFVLPNQLEPWIERS